MAGTVRGRFVDESGRPVQRLTADVFVHDPYAIERPLGNSTALDGSGAFSINIPWGPRFGFTHVPGRVKVTDFVGRIVWMSPQLNLADALTRDIDLGSVTIHSAAISGWLVTNRDSHGRTQYVSSASSVEFYIDNALAWAQLEQAVSTGTGDIYLQLFYFDVGNVFLRFTPDPPVIGTGAPTPGSTLERALEEAGRRGRHVYLLIRGGNVLSTDRRVGYPGFTDAEVLARLGRAANVQVRRYGTDARFPMHAKFFVDYRQAHIMGSPLMSEYFDDPQHRICDPRRGLLDAAGLTARNQIRVPIHDVGLRLTGPIIDSLLQTFRMHWNRVGDPIGPFPTTTAPADGRVTGMQIVRSLPGNTFPGLPDGETGVLEAYQRALAGAEQLVYLENQYFTDDVLADSIVRALRHNPNLHIVMLINTQLDIPLYSHTLGTNIVRLQPALIARIQQELRSARAINRLGIFTLWGHESVAAPGRHRIIRNYVHSKLAVVDDRWATVGSANLDGVSLSTSQHLFHQYGLGQSHWVSDEHQRATEVNALLFDRIGGFGASDVPGRLRRALWAEHLGFANPAAPELALTTGAAALQLWRERAAAKLAGLRASPITVHPARILEWRPFNASADVLRDLGVDVGRFEVLNEFCSFDFATSRWVRPPIGS